ncbi:MAG: glycosyltransferase [Planctomycetaceae bacterium]
MTNLQRWKIRLLIGAGLAALGYFISWWFESDRLSNPWLLVLLAGAVLYCVVRGFFGCYISSRCKPDEWTEAPASLSVDVFVPAYDEPASLVERTLQAAKAMHYPHRTFLLDDGGRDELEALARRLDVGYFRRGTNREHKAGNVNHALERTSGEIVAIFDVDHVPCPDYLFRSLGPFEDSEIGFVQVRLDHSNGAESFVAGAAAERNDGFFGAPLHGMHGCGCPQKFGSNCLIRRSALQSVGGYKPGLAEDLHTSLHLHAEGWRSTYVSESLAKGLEPVGLSGFFIQQYKWAHGVTSLLRNVYPRLITRLDFETNICYAWRLTCFLAGPVVALCIVMTSIILYSGSEVLMDGYASYLLHAAPLVMVMWLVMVTASKPFASDPINRETRMPMAGMLLAFGSWPIFTHAFISAALGLKAAFVATPKERGGTGLKLILPQILAVLVLGSAMIRGLSVKVDLATMGVCVFAGMLIMMHSAVFWAFWGERTQEKVQADRIGGGEE